MSLVQPFKAYLNNNNVTDMSRLEYIFDQRKLLKNEFENLPNFNPANYFDDVAQAEQAIKGQFQVMIANNAQSVFNTKPDLFLGTQWNGVVINSWQDLQNLAALDNTFWQSDFFNFVKVL